VQRRKDPPLHGVQEPFKIFQTDARRVKAVAVWSDNLYQIYSKRMKELIREMIDEMWDEMFLYHGGVSTKAAAELLGVHEQTVRTWVKQGKLKSYGAGHNRFRVPDIIKFKRQR